MTEHEFILAIEGDPEAAGRLDALFEAGCDDAMFASVDGAWYADFTREAPTFQGAVLSAIRQVESVPGLKVIRIEPDDLVTASEIAGRLNISRQNVAQLISGERGSGRPRFPLPASHLTARTRLWKWSEVIAWYGGSVEDRARALWIAQQNESLERSARFRQHLRAIHFFRTTIAAEPYSSAFVMDSFRSFPHVGVEGGDARYLLYKTATTTLRSGPVTRDLIDLFLALRSAGPTYESQGDEAFIELQEAG